MKYFVTVHYIYLRKFQQNFWIFQPLNYLFFKCKQMVEFNKKLINDLFIVKWRNASEGKNCARAKNKLIEKRQLSNTKRTVHPTLFLEFIKKSVEVIRFLQKEQNKSMWPVLLLCRRHFQPVQKLKVYT